MKPWMMVAPLLLAAAGALNAQEGPGYRKVGEDYHELEIDVRLSLIGGDALGGTEWSDFYDNGIGFRFAWNQLWAVGEKVDVGASVGLSYDGYVGGQYSEFDSGLGETINYFPDPLHIIKIQGGFLTRLHFKPAWLDVRVALGGAFILDADIDVVSPSLDGSFEAIAATFTYCFDIGVRLGFDISPKTTLSIGFTMDFIGAPDAGDGFVSGTEFDPLQNAVISIGAEFRL